MEQREHSPLSFTAQFSPAVITGILAAGLTGFMLTHTPVSFTMMVSMCAFFIGQLIGGFAPVEQYVSNPLTNTFIKTSLLTCSQSLLGYDLRQHRHHAFRHGYVLPCRNSHSLQLHASRTPRSCCISRQHFRQLQHRHFPRYRWNCGDIFYTDPGDKGTETSWN